MISRKHLYILALCGLYNSMVVSMDVPRMLPREEAEAAKLAKRIAHVWRNTYRGLYTVDWDAAAARWIAEGPTGIAPFIRAAYERQTTLGTYYVAQMTEWVAENADAKAKEICAKDALAVAQSNQDEQRSDVLGLFQQALKSGQNALGAIDLSAAAEQIGRAAMGCRHCYCHYKRYHGEQ